MKRRQFLGATLAASAAATLAACGKSGSSDSGDVTISYFSWINEKSARPLVDAFEAANPGIKVDLQPSQGAANDYVQTLTTRIAGNQIPDVFHMSTATRPEIIDNGHALDLTNEPFMEGLDATGVEMYSKDGKKYGLPTSAWMGVIVYNKKLLSSVGYDSVPDTLDEFIALGKKLKAAGVKPYLEDPTVISGSFLPMVGGHYAKAGTTDAGLFDGSSSFVEQWTKPITEWKRLSDEEVLPKEAISLSDDLVKQAFLGGEVAMIRSGTWVVEEVRQAGIEFGAAPFPALSDGEPFIGGGPDSPFAISAKLEGKKLEAAKKFLAFVASKEGLEILNKAGWVSTSANFSAPVPEEFTDVYENYLKAGKYYWLNLPEGGSNIEAIMPKEFQLLLQGQKTPEQVAQALDDAWKAR